MTDDFSVIDFALVAAQPEQVVLALGQVQSARQGGEPADKAAGGRTRLFSRMRLGQPDAATPRPLQMQPPGTLPTGPLARVRPDDLGYGAGESPFRVSAPISKADRDLPVVLVEFREEDGDTSMLCEALSAELPGTEVFRFRLSGSLHPGADTAFHVYLDGRATRRVASISAEGTAPEANWRIVDAGMPHAMEAESLPGARARAWEIMTPERQASIIGSMGLDAEQLFEPDPGRIVVELDTAGGGRPLAEAARRFSPSASPAQSDSGASAGIDAGPSPDEKWEEEVTQILITAVAHALPEPEQVPWLTRLTRMMEQGEVERALRDARALIARGSRPEADRSADAARLDALFGLDPQGQGDPPQRI
ncbi:MAG: hypothetical protein AAFU80_02255 [Pseudomonadota bacterium]